MCTPRVAHAAVVGEQSGIPSVVVAGPAFKKQAEVTAYDQGVPSLRVAVYPGPFDLHSDSELRENAVKMVVPQVIEALTKPLTRIGIRSGGISQGTEGQGNGIHGHDR